MYKIYITSFSDVDLNSPHFYTRYKTSSFFCWNYESLVSSNTTYSGFEDNFLFCANLDLGKDMYFEIKKKRSK